MKFESKKPKHLIIETFEKNNDEEEKTREEFNVACSTWQGLLHREALLPDGGPPSAYRKGLSGRNLPGTALFVIKRYADRIRSVHEKLEELILGFRWSKLGKQCDRDIAVLDTLIGPDKKGIRADLVSMITRLRDTWVESHGLNETRCWYEVRRPIRECNEKHRFGHIGDLEEAARFGDDFSTCKTQWHATMEELTEGEVRLSGSGDRIPDFVEANRKITQEKLPLPFRRLRTRTSRRRW